MSSATKLEIPSCLGNKYKSCQNKVRSVRNRKRGTRFRFARIRNMQTNYNLSKKSRSNKKTTTRTYRKKILFCSDTTSRKMFWQRCIYTTSFTLCQTWIFIRTYPNKKFTRKNSQENPAFAITHQPAKIQLFSLGSIPSNQTRQQKKNFVKCNIGETNFCKTHTVQLG